MHPEFNIFTIKTRHQISRSDSDICHRAQNLRVLRLPIPIFFLSISINPQKWRCFVKLSVRNKYLMIWSDIIMHNLSVYCSNRINISKVRSKSDFSVMPKGIYFKQAIRSHFNRYQRKCNYSRQIILFLNISDQIINTNHKSLLWLKWLHLLKVAEKCMLRWSWLLEHDNSACALMCFGKWVQKEYENGKLCILACFVVNLLRVYTPEFWANNSILHNKLILHKL